MSRCILYMESLLSCLQFCESCHRKSILSYRETGGQWDGGICKSPAWSSGSCSLFPELSQAPAGSCSVSQHVALTHAVNTLLRICPGSP